MAAVTFDGGPARSSADRNIFLVLVCLVWVGILTGFGLDSYLHVRKHGLDYPPIVHIHAVTFVGWLVLFTAQVALVRNGRPDLHRKLGILGMVLAGAVLVMGPAAALIVDARKFVATGETPEFLAIQLTDMIAFATFTGAGLFLRNRDTALHKRLMLMGLFYISNAGFGRFLNWMVVSHPGTLAADLVGFYLGGDLLMLALGVYDLLTRKHLYPAYIAGFAWALTLQITAQWLFHGNATWKAFTLWLIGH